MSKRKSISMDIVVAVLTSSKRRCALCFGLSGDLKEKKGQIAHLDQNSSNNSEENLVFLCLDHHDQFDSSTSQSKGLTKEEVRTYRKHLYLAIETGLDSESTSGELKEKEIIIHDRENFDRANSILSEGYLITFLDILQSNDSYTKRRVEPVHDFCFYFKETGNYYLLPELEEVTKELISNLGELLNFLAYNFFVFPKDKFTDEDCWFALYPDLNIDRNGDGSVEQMEKYGKFQRKLNEFGDKTRKSYKKYRLAVKRNLLC